MGASYTLLKRCACPKARHAKCPHPFYFHCHPRGQQRWRFNLNDEVGEATIRSMSEADAFAAPIYALIKEGKFVPRAQRAAANTVAVVAKAEAVERALTFDQFKPIYVQRVSKARARNKSWRDDQAKLNVLGRQAWDDPFRDQETTLGQLKLAAITEDDLETVFAQLRETRSVATMNNFVTLVRKAFRWAAKKGYIASTPITEDSEIKRGTPVRRHRRLEKAHLTAQGQYVDSTETRLLRHASDQLGAIVLAALDTCCRLGELLTLQWAEVDLIAGTFTIDATKAKSGKGRLIPLTDRLWTLLKTLSVDPAGIAYTSTDYVFGPCGQELKSIRTAWETCLLWAHGITPRWKGPGQGLTDECLAELKQINLHFHDLRHEGASRYYFERGWTLVEVQELLGHASIDTTRIYLNVEQGALLARMRATEATARALENQTQTDTGTGIAAPATRADVVGQGR